ncbi:MAG: putative methylase [Methanothermobacter sp.]|nr:putative methylase [Methanothermobacter sp.]
MLRGNMIRRKRHLEMLLEKVPAHPDPDPGLEQYLTPPGIAAEVLWAARAMGDIEGKTVADLGCGTGILGIGAALLGAEMVYCIDIDSGALEAGRSAAGELGLGNIRFMEADIRHHDALPGMVDTVVQNPPFGSQERAERGADRVFMDAAAATGRTVYSFHMAGSEDFVRNYYRKLGGTVTHRFRVEFPIPRTYSFHRMEVASVGVVILRVVF